MGIDINHPKIQDTSNEPNTSSFFADLDVDNLEEKPWEAKNADITDWFNYGFTEETWREYCTAQVKWRKYLKYKAPSTTTNNNSLGLSTYTGSNVSHFHDNNNNVITSHHIHHTNESGPDNAIGQVPQPITTFNNSFVSNVSAEHVGGTEHHERKIFLPSRESTIVVNAPTNPPLLTSIQNLPAEQPSIVSTTDIPQVMTLRAPDVVVDQGIDDERRQPTSHLRRKGVCFDFQKHGYCRRGANCRYQHIRDISNIIEATLGMQQNPALAVSMLNAPLSGANTIVSNFGIKKPSDVCFEFEQKGLCQWGAQCRYKHISKETNNLGNTDPLVLNQNPNHPIHLNHPTHSNHPIHPNHPIHNNNSQTISINPNIKNEENFDTPNPNPNPNTGKGYITTEIDMNTEADKPDKNNLNSEELSIVNTNNPIPITGPINAGIPPNGGITSIIPTPSIPPPVAVGGILSSFARGMDVTTTETKIPNVSMMDPSLAVSELLGMNVPSIQSIQTQMLTKDMKENPNRHKQSRSRSREEESSNNDSSVENNDKPDENIENEEGSSSEEEDRSKYSRSVSRSSGSTRSRERGRKRSRSHKDQEKNKHKIRDKDKERDRNRDRDRDREKRTKNRDDWGSRSRSRHKR